MNLYNNGSGFSEDTNGFEGFGGVICAGGRGMRLSPLTDETPKPLLPICETTSLEMAVKSLAAAGIEKIAVTTSYLAEKVESTAFVGLKSKNGKAVTVKYFREKSPLGTAGGVRELVGILKENFFVVCGDAVFDFDLGKAFSHHKRNNAAATLILTHAENPTEFGTVIARDGFVEAFCEKPSWNRTLSDLVNSGIYVINKRVFDGIGNGFCDFASDIFPYLMRKNQTICCVEDNGYWCDIGDRTSYRKCCLRFSDGKVNAVSPSAVIGEGVAADGCVICSGAIIGDKTSAVASIIAKDAKIGKNCRIGASVAVGEGAYVPDGSDVPENTLIPAGTVYSSKLSAEGIFESNAVFNPSGICREAQFGEAIAKAYGVGSRIGFAHDGSDKAVALSQILAGSIRLCGCDCYDFGTLFESLSQFAAREYAIDLLVFTDKTGKQTIFDSSGLPASRAAERKIEGALKAPAVNAHHTGALLCSGSELKLRYTSRLTNAIGDVSGISVHVPSNNDPEKLLIRLLSLCGATVENEKKPHTASFEISDDGKTLTAKTETGNVVDHKQIYALNAGFLAESGKQSTFSIPCYYPESVERYIVSKGGNTVFYSDAPGNERVPQNTLSSPYDAVGMATCAVLAMFSLSSSLNDYTKDFPKTAEKEGFISCSPDYKAKIIGSLSASEGTPFRKGHGIRFDAKGGSFVITPEYTSAFRIFVEAVSAETASEIFDLASSKLQSAAPDGFIRRL